jgi:hypothetical protein
MLEELATHDVQDIADVFNLMGKCTRAVDSHAWHTLPAPEAGKVGKTDADAAA